MQSAVADGVLRAELRIDDATEQLLSIQSLLSSAGYSGTAVEMIYAALHDLTEPEEELKEAKAQIAHLEARLRYFSSGSKGFD